MRNCSVFNPPFEGGGFRRMSKDGGWPKHSHRDFWSSPVPINRATLFKEGWGEKRHISWILVISETCMSFRTKMQNLRHNPARPKNEMPAFASMTRSFWVIGGYRYFAPLGEVRNIRVAS